MATLRALVLATTIAALLGCGLGSQGPGTEDRAPGRIPRAEAVIASVAGAEAESRAIADAILGASDPVLAAAQAGQGLWTAARAYAAASLDDRPLYLPGSAMGAQGARWRNLRQQLDNNGPIRK